MTFYVKYLGSTLVDELEDGESYGEGTSSEAVKIIVAMVSLYVYCLSAHTHVYVNGKSS